MPDRGPARELPQRRLPVTLTQPVQWAPRLTPRGFHDGATLAHLSSFQGRSPGTRSISSPSSAAIGTDPGAADPGQTDTAMRASRAARPTPPDRYQPRSARRPRATDRPTARALRRLDLSAQSRLLCRNSASTELMFCGADGVFRMLNRVGVSRRDSPLAGNTGCMLRCTC